MEWKIVCYNGTVWNAPIQMLLTSAIKAFIKDTGLTEWDIKSVTNLH